MAEINKDQHSFLSDDLIIEEILTRLPIKSILRFKSVSKQWYSTLSSPDFAHAHLIKSPFSHPCAPVNTLFIQVGNKNYLFSYDDDDDDQISHNFEDNLIELDVDFGVGKDHLVLRGCCNGLVCLSPPKAEYFIIWNPATRKLNKYASHGYLNRLDEADDYKYITSGFGYASSVDDYKYVIFSVDRQNTQSYIILIFSLRENRWRKIDHFLDCHVRCYASGVLVSDKLYWFAYSKQDIDLAVLVSFDLAVERFDVVNIDGDKFDILGVMGGCLSKCIYLETYPGDKLLHIMEPPVIVKSIGLPKGLRLNVFSEMIGFTKTNKIFMTRPGSSLGEGINFRCRRELGIVDTCTESMQYRTLLIFNDLITIVRYVPTLVSPFPIEA